MDRGERKNSGNSRKTQVIDRTKTYLLFPTACHSEALAKDGGGDGIRTRDHLTAIPAFQASALDQLCDPSKTCIILKILISDKEFP